MAVIKARSTKQPTQFSQQALLERSEALGSQGCDHFPALPLCPPVTPSEAVICQHQVWVCWRGLRLMPCSNHVSVVLLGCVRLSLMVSGVMRGIHCFLLICSKKKKCGRLTGFQKSLPPTPLSLLACLCGLGLIFYPYHHSWAFWGAARVAPGCRYHDLMECQSVHGHPWSSERCFLPPPWARRDL